MEKFLIQLNDTDFVSEFSKPSCQMNFQRKDKDQASEFDKGKALLHLAHIKQVFPNAAIVPKVN